MKHKTIAVKIVDSSLSQTAIAHTKPLKCFVGVIKRALVRVSDVRDAAIILEVSIGKVLKSFVESHYAIMLKKSTISILKSMSFGRSRGQRQIESGCFTPTIALQAITGVFLSKSSVLTLTMLVSSILLVSKVTVATCVIECVGFFASHVTSRKSCAITSKPSKWPFLYQLCFRLILSCFLKHHRISITDAILSLYPKLYNCNTKGENIEHFTLANCG